MTVLPGRRGRAARVSAPAASAGQLVFKPPKRRQPFMEPQKIHALRVSGMPFENGPMRCRIHLMRLNSGRKEAIMATFFKPEVHYWKVTYQPSGHAIDTSGGHDPHNEHHIVEPPLPRERLVPPAAYLHSEFALRRKRRSEEDRNRFIVGKICDQLHFEIILGLKQVNDRYVQRLGRHGPIPYELHTYFLGRLRRGIISAQRPNVRAVIAMNSILFDDLRIMMRIVPPGLSGQI